MAPSPRVGCTNPSSRRIVVVFPEPLRPKKAKTLPRGTSRFSPSTAGLPPKYRVRPRVKITGCSFIVWLASLHLFPLAEFLLECVLQFLMRKIQGHRLADGRVDQRLQTSPGLLGGKHFSFASDKNAATGPGFNQSIPGQIGIGVSDGVRIHDQLLCQRADAGELVAHGQPAGDNGLPHLIGDLFVDRDPRTDADDHAETHCTITYSTLGRKCQWFSERWCSDRFLKSPVTLVRARGLEPPTLSGPD